MLQHIRHRKGKYIEFVKSRKIGLATGFSSLDKMIYGLQPGYHLIASRPSVGKTSLAMNMAIQMALAKHKVLFFSIEMSEPNFIERVIAILTGVTTSDIRNDTVKEDQKESLIKVNDTINDLDMYVDYTSQHTSASMQTQINFLKENDSFVPAVIFVDYIQYMKTVDNRFPKQASDLAEISRGLVQICKNMGIPLIALAQLNRGADDYVTKTDRKEWIPKVPRLADLKGTGALEEDTDTVLLLHRKDYHREREDKDFDSSTAPIDNATVYVAKNRHGPCGSFNLTWIPEVFQFIEMKGDNGNF